MNSEKQGNSARTFKNQSGCKSKVEQNKLQAAAKALSWQNKPISFFFFPSQLKILCVNCKAKKQLPEGLGK